MGGVVIRPGLAAPTCALCDVDLGEDPHWHDIFQTWVCETHCPCESAVGGGSDDDRPFAHAPDGDHRTGLLLPGTVVPAADGVLPRWMLAELELSALYVRRERLAWLVTAALWTLVVLVGLDAA